MTTASTKRAINPWLKLTLEMGPLVVFFVTNQQRGIYTATMLFMVAVAASLVVTWLLTRHLPIMPLVSAFVVLVFGGLTVWLQDDVFIKLKPTIVNTMFGVILLGGLAFGRSLLSVVLDSVFKLTEEGWKKLTLRWALFFFVLAALNEVVWRTQTTDFWVNFKVFGVMPLTIAFALSQTPLILKYENKDAEPDPDNV